MTRGVGTVEPPQAHTHESRRRICKWPKILQTTNRKKESGLAAHSRSGPLGLRGCRDAKPRRFNGWKWTGHKIFEFGRSVNYDNTPSSALARRRPASSVDMPILPRPRVLVFFAFLTLLGTFYLTLEDLPKDQLSSINIPFLTPDKPQVLLVSAFFPLAKAKHTHKEYAKWMTLYLSKVTTPIYFFAPPEMETTIRKLRGNLPMTLNTTFTTPFDIPPLKGLEGRYADMNKVDPENAYHSPELYAVWSSKTYFLREALLTMQSAGMKVEYAFWNDAGSFREKQDYADWPDLERVNEIFTRGAELSNMHKDELFFMPMWDIPKDNLRDWTPLEGPKEFEGGFLEGLPGTIVKF